MPALRRFALCCALLSPLFARSGELVVLVDTGTDMPMARFDHYRLVAGVHKDIGEALARAMGRTPKFLALPRKRIPLALDSGEADVLCGYVPEWLDGRFGWSQPFYPQVEVVLSDRAAPRPSSVAELAGQQIGTVFGFSYPELDRALGKDFVRADAPSIELNFRKLAAGRLRHMVTMKSWSDYRIKTSEPGLSLHPPLVVTTYMTRCAVSPKSKVGVADVNRAIARIVKDGAVPAIAARYR
ncbi:transporter substrate-binding domain-containing protein [Massilia sp. R2A-15]|uniref:substrate-binding periplasmic protein n=1 Tax=Massilia sp. R2A-15 TaxID=3064278 RepID=UPI0027367B09|nr:transporter substrate-binding domain-containing protein [Massilia sp. R2A-15]WLI90347.1 transporter substrate-binding domain-containing protein [Massilia sp. R2A-15]